MDITTFTSIEGMDSRDIAKTVNKAHRNVCRDIEEQIGKLEGGVLRFEHTYRNAQNGQSYRCYVLPKRECLILATGYDVVLRAKLIDRWAELESGAATPIGQRLDPQILQYEKRVSFLEGLIEGLRGKTTYAVHSPSQPRTNRVQPVPTYQRKGDGLPVKIAPWVHPKIAAAQGDILAMPTPVGMNEIFAMLREEHGVQRNRGNEMGVSKILKDAGLLRRKISQGKGQVWVYERI